MKIIIDIKHPAHVHFFKNFINIMKKNGHEILITARNKDVTLSLLKRYNIPYIKISSVGHSKLDLMKELIIRNYKFYKIAKKFKPDILLATMGVTIAPIGRLIGLPSIVFYNNESAKLTNRFAYCLSTIFITPASFRINYGKKQLRYKGCHELAYLHPNYFKPNSEVLKRVGLNRDEKFSIIRFVSWGASHDIGHKGIALKNKIRAVKEFRKHGKVFISSENLLPKELNKYCIKLSPEKLHHLLYYASLLYGESATLASEAAILGTPAIYLDNIGRGYTDEQEKYGLIFNFSESMEEQKKSIKKGVEILKNQNSKNYFKNKKNDYIKSNIDLTKFMIEQVLKYINNT